MKKKNRYSFNSISVCSILLLFLVSLLTGCSKDCTSRISAKEVELATAKFRTVSDYETGLMYAAHDSPVELNYCEAKIYCESFRAGGYDDWRMPTLDELRKLNEQGITREKLIPGQLIKIHWRVWSSEVNIHDGDMVSAATFSFNIGRRRYLHPGVSTFNAALPVRNLDW